MKTIKYLAIALLAAATASCADESPTQLGKVEVTAKAIAVLPENALIEFEVPKGSLVDELGQVTLFAADGSESSTWTMRISESKFAAAVGELNPSTTYQLRINSMDINLNGDGYGDDEYSNYIVPNFTVTTSKPNDYSALGYDTKYGDIGSHYVNLTLSYNSFVDSYSDFGGLYLSTTPNFEDAVRWHDYWVDRPELTISDLKPATTYYYFIYMDRIRLFYHGTDEYNYGEVATDFYNVIIAPQNNKFTTAAE